MKVGIVGGTGRMGRWFARYFIANHHEVGIFSRNLSKAEEFATSVGARAYGSLQECCKASGLLIISVPISATPQVIQQIAPYLRKDAILIDIASIKEGIIDNLRELDSGILAIAVHPLFGPGADINSVNRYALTPVQNGEKEKMSFKRLFHQSEIMVVSAEEHDMAMAKVLSLTHFMNTLFLKTLGSGISNLSKLSGTTFGIQLALAMGVMHDDPNQLASLQVHNSHFPKVLDEMIRHAVEWRDLVVGGKKEELSAKYNKMRRAIEKDKVFKDSYEKMYAMFRSLQSDEQ